MSDLELAYPAQSVQLLHPNPDERQQVRCRT